jgi:endonuclease/exonuclease/phosphatase family metal-dependent hydrolase
MGAGWTAYFHGDSEGVAVIVRTSRLAVAAVENRNIGPSSWGGTREAVRVRVRIDGRDIDLFGTHLDWPSTNTWEECGAVSIQNSAHACGRNNFTSWVGSFGGHKVYAGDMNARHTGNAVQQETMRQLDARGINSCAIHGTATQCDASYPTKSTRIDHIYRATSMSTISHVVGTHGGLSDHNPVVAVFEVP